MAATVGTTIPSVTFPLRHAGLGPFISSTGTVYFVGRYAVNTGQVSVSRTDDPMSGSWTTGVFTMSSTTTTAIEAIAAYQVGDVVHIATQIATGAVYYDNYRFATNNPEFSSGELAVAAASFAPTTNYAFVSLVVRSSGEVVVLYSGGQTAMSSTFNMVRAIRRTGTATWVNLAGAAGGTNVDNGGSVNWGGGVAVLGASDRVHCFFGDLTNGRAYQRTITQANALQAFPAHYDTSTTTNASARSGGLSYASGGQTRVRALYHSTTAPAASTVAMLDSSDAPTVSTQAWSDAVPSVQNLQYIMSLAEGNGTLHALRGATNLNYDTDGGTGTWGTDTNQFSGTINRISSDVYTRAGTQRLAMVIDDSGTLKYAEIDLAGSLAGRDLNLVGAAGIRGFA